MDMTASAGPDPARAADRRILALAIPALGTLAVEPLYVLTDTAIVGRLGTVPLGGLALAATVLNTLVWVMNFLSFGTTSRVAHLTGQGRHAEAARSAAQALWLAGVLGVAIGAGLAASAPVLARVLGGEGAVQDVAVTYLRISAVGVPFILVPLASQGYLRGLSDTRTPLRIVLLANLANLVIELVLVFGFDLGVAGSAWSTVVAQAASAVWFLAILAPRIAATGCSLRPDPRAMRGLVTVGRHLLVRTGALIAALAASTAGAARLGPVSLAAHQITLQLFTFLALVVDALAISAQALVGTSLGEGDAPAVRLVCRRLMRMGLRVGLALAAAVVATSPLLPRLFSGDERVVVAATGSLAMLGILQIPAAIAFVLDGVLMGADDFRFLQRTTVSALAAFAPLAVLVVVTGAGLTALWGALIVWMTVRTAVSYARYRTGGWLTA
jgi:putative MATE family efflux protein